MIGIDIRELTSLKILQPICEYFIKNNVPYALYHCDMPRGSKEYNRASLKNIKLSSPRVVKHAQVTRPYSKNNKLVKFLIADKIKKFVGVELFLCYGNDITVLKNNGISSYSILYLTDDLWKSKANTYEKVYRTYFNSEFLMNTALKFSGAKYDSNKHRCLGTPLFDQLQNVVSGDKTLVLLPNINSSQVSQSFGSKGNFVNIIKKLSEQNDLIFKTRKKQWLPGEITKYAKEIIIDGSLMYPSAIVGAFSKCRNVVMFYSSGIYETVAAGKHVINIPLSLNRWVWNKNKLSEYFSKLPGSLYSFDGVVKNVEQNDIVSGNFSLSETIDLTQRGIWVGKFVAPLKYNSAKAIVDDILSY